MNKYITLLLILFSLSACQSDTTSKENQPLDYKQLATSYCDCATTSIELSNKALELLNKKEDKAFNSLLSDIQKHFDETLSCAKDKRGAYEKTPLDIEKLNTHLKRYCEDMPSKLRNVLSEKIQ